MNRSRQWPLAAKVAENVNPVIGICEVTRDLYGYCDHVLDEAATRNLFAKAYRDRTATPLNPAGYSPGKIEMEVAMDILRDRANHIIRRSLNSGN